MVIKNSIREFFIKKTYIIFIVYAICYITDKIRKHQINQTIVEIKFHPKT